MIFLQIFEYIFKIMNKYQKFKQNFATLTKFEIPNVYFKIAMGGPHL